PLHVHCRACDSCSCHSPLFSIFSFTHTPPTDIYTLSLHDALPISQPDPLALGVYRGSRARRDRKPRAESGNATGRSRTSNSNQADRKSTRLNSSHDQISYAVFCLKKKT